MIIRIHCEIKSKSLIVSGIYHSKKKTYPVSLSFSSRPFKPQSTFIYYLSYTFYSPSIQAGLVKVSDKSNKIKVFDHNFLVKEVIIALQKIPLYHTYVHHIMSHYYCFYYGI